ncbi:hypothetical protein BGW80DRAFT_878076 [Lactifluus volemus]|nr:hypothetical protein BGW80DRAFT_878076 [Lactifluus volemus]
MDPSVSASTPLPLLHYLQYSSDNLELRHVIEFLAFSPSQSRASLSHLIYTPLLTLWALCLDACCVHFFSKSQSPNLLLRVLCSFSVFLHFNDPNVPRVSLRARDSFRLYHRQFTPQLPKHLTSKCPYVFFFGPCISCQLVMTYILNGWARWANDGQCQSEWK